MKEKLALLLILAIPCSLFAQQKFKIDLSSPSLINKSLILAPSPWVKELKGLYCLNLDTNKNIIDFCKNNGFEKSVYQITVQEKNSIRGEFAYPVPVTFQFVDPENNQLHLSSKFFLDSGSYKIDLPKVLRRCDINLNSPVNNEYADFKKLFVDFYISQDKLFDSLTNLAEKENRVASYIRKNPDSYVALWEIIDDYFTHDYVPVYLENLRLFSASMKTSKLFTTFEGILKHDSSSNKGNKFELERSVVAGSLFPEIDFDGRNMLTKEDFKKSELTLIDCWATWCGYCVKAMPGVVALYNEYKDLGVNFISVALENDPKKIKLANEILKKNNVKWKNYFDIKKDFNDKVGVVAIPLLFLVDQNGKIVERVNSADIDFIKKTIDDYLRNEKNE
ncbi:TlpA family protein disulfide reductase [Pinibacter aurantiacus]|uniref:TlpA family protein disulfide reductase n=1 Tax=Pinibacter aurantiacus TaxID=2851599 RepID=A0A9E2SDB1_9BACT|nr:TlpA disulfide reductase family protein [Pinibacter aurantiacus]MBV4360012.1 TlpA family protein disulfide reductase [Pinibacter aurantiacus]